MKDNDAAGAGGRRSDGVRGGHRSAGRVTPSPQWWRVLEGRAKIRERLEANVRSEWSNAVNV